MDTAINYTNPQGTQSCWLNALKSFTSVMPVKFEALALLKANDVQQDPGKAWDAIARKCPSFPKIVTTRNGVAPKNNNWTRLQCSDMTSWDAALKSALITKLKSGSEMPAREMKAWPNHLVVSLHPPGKFSPPLKFKSYKLMATIRVVNDHATAFLKARSDWTKWDNGAYASAKQALLDHTYMAYYAKDTD